ncbi:hypothetical protein JX265_007646 [Neoarthrinium moseri]|uniref:Enolase-phosphatase E1 n=1 Tax=Neoarthrinium moseri TaxID=1658444 RepID=A0A9Q0AL00_9PEZI|nr:uncharacterized protein JN550_012785 [Neoarthrinium moseri]KAI1854485.1 hypothetical protein JX266_000603 [Neoarthrinium moseri]KAI1858335.1 hypothetical protein JN550_012785 [Neoarthrinium moseri]KAI1867070.1 hypothetical protein JX265_007646 [Neoarthrinium moseri]
MAASAAIKVVVLDIEGTVCPISFVRDVLFPYFLEKIPETVKSEWDSSRFKEYRDAFPEEFRSSQEAFQAHVIDLVSRDVKIAYLKSLQGYIWQEGYASGEIKAPLFADVPTVLSRWHGKGIKLIIYSSGSVPAQKLLFKYTNAEPSDLTVLLTDYFDTVNAGPKTEAASYEKIVAKHPEFLPEQFLFLSDNVKEVDAAIQAGMRSAVVQRPGNADLPTEVYDTHQVVETFDSIEEDFNVKTLQTLGKRSADEAAADEKPEAQPADTTEPEGAPDSKKVKTSIGEEGATQGEEEPAEEPSQIDKLLAQAVGDAPITPTETTSEPTELAE